jgi:hypothetical protein
LLKLKKAYRVLTSLLVHLYCTRYNPPALAGHCQPIGQGDVKRELRFTYLMKFIQVDDKGLKSL